MTHLNHSDTQSTPIPTPAKDEHFWPVKALGWMFIGQAVILIGTGVYYLLTANEKLAYGPTAVLPAGEIIEGLSAGVLVSLILFPLSLIVIIAGVGFFRRWPVAWLYAMTAQGLILALSMTLYFYEAPNYWAMVSSTFLVLYLNYADGQANLQGQSIEAEERGLA